MAISLASSEIDLSWSQVPEAAMYDVYCGVSPALLLPVGQTAGLAFAIPGLQPGRYFVQVIARFSARSSIAGCFDNSGSGGGALDALGIADVADVILTVQFSGTVFASSNGSPNPLTIEVDISGPPSSMVSVDYTTGDGAPPICVLDGFPQCGVAGIHYMATSGTLAWDAGDSTPRTFDIEQLGRSYRAYVTLSNPVGASIVGTNPAEFGDTDF